jgi:hypothetical protein
MLETLLVAYCIGKHDSKIILKNWLEIKLSTPA